MIVIDASAIVEVLLRSDRGTDVERARLATEDALHAPHLADVEVVSAIRHLLLARQIDRPRAELALGLFDLMRLQRWSMVPLRARIWALRSSVSAYDASYLALAERLGCPLVTCDRKLAGSSGHRASIEAY